MKKMMIMLMMVFSGVNLSNAQDFTITKTTENSAPHTYSATHAVELHALTIVGMENEEIETLEIRFYTPTQDELDVLAPQNHPYQETIGMKYDLLMSGDDYHSQKWSLSLDPGVEQTYLSENIQKDSLKISFPMRYCPTNPSYQTSRLKVSLVINGSTEYEIAIDRFVEFETLPSLLYNDESNLLELDAGDWEGLEAISLKIYNENDDLLNGLFSLNSQEIELEEYDGNLIAQMTLPNWECFYKILYIEQETMGVEEQNLNDFTLYPNPSAEWVYLSQEMSSLKIFDLNGRKVLEETTISSINITDLSSGVYLLRGTTIDGIEVSQKIVKKGQRTHHLGTTEKFLCGFFVFLKKLYINKMQYSIGKSIQLLFIP